MLTLYSSPLGGCSLPCEHYWGSPTRHSTSPPRNWSSSRSETAPRPQVQCSTWLAETSLWPPWRSVWGAAVGRQSEPPGRRWADATAPHKSLNDASAVLKDHTHVWWRWSVRRAGRPQPQNDNRGWKKLPPPTLIPQRGAKNQMSTVEVCPLMKKDTEFLDKQWAGVASKQTDSNHRQLPLFEQNFLLGRNSSTGE